MLEGEVLVDDADGHRALADGGGDALDRAGAAVADGEDAGEAGLQGEGGAADRAGGAAEVGDLEVDPGEEEAVVVLGEGAVEPLGARVGADEDEKAAATEVATLATAVVFDDDPLERVLAAHLADLGVDEQLDVVDRFDLVDEVAGHALAQVAAA